MADIVGLTCTKCKNRNYVTKVNKKKQSKKLEIKKFCKFCRESVLHKESKQYKIIICLQVHGSIGRALVSKTGGCRFESCWACHLNLNSDNGLQFILTIIYINRDEVQQKVNRLFVFMREAKAELKKVTWPGKQQIWYSTLIVIVFTLLVSLYLGIIDMALTGILSRVFS